MKYYLAIDIGASSGRHILGYLDHGKFFIEEVYRFDNTQITSDGHVCWDLDCLWNGILDGLKACKDSDRIPVSVGIDTWAVDFVLVDGQGTPVSDAVAYHDSRCVGMDLEADRLVSGDKLYSRTGIQKLSFNTLYQLMALKKEHPEQLSGAQRMLMLPDYFHYKLSGVLSNEYTIASTTGLMNAADRTWDREIISELGFPQKLFGEISAPGSVLGHFLPEVQREVGFDSLVVLPCAHDTGSAFLAMPARDDNAVYLSSGTWSLLGVENDRPITSEESRIQNFTNEGSVEGRYRYLKNIMGLWMNQSIRRELNEGYLFPDQNPKKAARRWSYPDLIAAAMGASDFQSRVNVNRREFLTPVSMIDAVREECRSSGQQVPETVGEVMQCIYASLSLCYRDAICSLQKLTGRQYTSINIVGGGCQDGYLNKLTAQVTGLPVCAGPVEGTAVGNLIIQMITAGELADLAAARKVVRASFDVKEINP